MGKIPTKIDSMKTTRPGNSLQEDQRDNVILLTGAGASAHMGLKTLESIVDPARGLRISLADEYVSNTIQLTWLNVKARHNRSATFEQVIGQLQYYANAASLMETDHVFRSKLNDIPHHIDTGSFRRIWQDALSECFHIMLDTYGPSKIDKECQELAITIDLFKNLARVNKDRLHIFTTNYDCAVHVVQSVSSELGIMTHIDPQRDGHFSEGWHFARSDLPNEKLPHIYIHRLHGCVAWFSDARAPFGLREVYGAGENLEIKGDLIREMCIKLVSTEKLGFNPAFSLAFDEFFEQLKHCKILLVWGHSFRDIEVLRTIRTAYEARQEPFQIIYLDPYLSEFEAIENIRYTLAGDPVGSRKQIGPKRIPWVTNDGIHRIVPSVIQEIETILAK